MTYLLNVFDGSATITDHRVSLVAIGEGVLATLEVVDDEETVIAAFTYTARPWSFDATGEYIAELDTIYANWRESVGATKTVIPDAES